MANALKENIWTEKYRPETLSDCILPDAIRKQVDGMIKNGFPHLLLSGPAGTGKTTLAHIICNELDASYIMFNGSSGELNIDALRNRIEDFGQVGSLTGNKNSTKFIIIDEADGLSAAIQGALRNVMEKFRTVRFILTCNYPDKVIDPIHSRCSMINYSFDKETLNSMVRGFAVRCMGMLKNEGIECDPTAIMELIKKFYPDNRKIINELQRYSNNNGKIDMGILDFSSTSSDDMFGYIVNNDFAGLKTFLESNDVSSCFNMLYSDCEKHLSSDQIPAFVMAIGSYQRYHGVVPNQRLNILSAITEYWVNIS